MGKYDDIIDMEYPFPSKSGRKKMPMDERAKIFLPFSALRGYEEAIDRKLAEYEDHTSSEDGAEE